MIFLRIRRLLFLQKLSLFEEELKEMKNIK